MARLNLSPDEVAIIEEVRKTKAIWNSAIDAAYAVIQKLEFNGVYDLSVILEDIKDLRK